MFCPFHNNYRSPAGEVAKDTGMFWCFACHKSATLEELVMHVSGRTYFEAVRFVSERSTDDDIVEIIDTALEAKPEFTPYDEVLIRRLNKQALDSRRAMGYFYGRNISQDSVSHYMLGFSEKQDMVTIPIASPDGVWVGFVARSIEGKEFKNTPGMPRSKTLFNLSNAKRYDNIFVVESSFDAIRIEQVGGHAVATLGSRVSKGQQRLLTKYFNSVIVIGDNDMAGKIMVQEALTALPNASTLELPEGVKDVGSMTDSELKSFIATVADPLVAMLQ